MVDAFRRVARHARTPKNLELNAHGMELVAALPAGVARLEVVGRAGHFTWLDAPDRYWPTLVDFVRSSGVSR